MAGLFDSLARYGQVQAHLGAIFSLVVDNMTVTSMTGCSDTTCVAKRRRRRAVRQGIG